MRISTRQGERGAAAGPWREETYDCALGTGRLLLSGDLPLEHELPDPRRKALRAAGPPSRWGGLLEQYFAGRPVAFDLDVVAYADALGFTAFEREVYLCLAAVPYGTALSYRDLAVAAGHPNAYRAVGTAMSRNRLPVILPCHRVIKNDGRLGQYGDDPAWKERLLALEGVRLTREERR